MNKIEIPSINNVKEGVVFGIISIKERRDGRIEYVARVALRIEEMHNTIFNEGERIIVL